METKNLFEGAEFGDRYRTRDGRRAVFVYRHLCGDVTMIIQEPGELYRERVYMEDGRYFTTMESECDIIAKE